MEGVAGSSPVESTITETEARALFTHDSASFSCSITTSISAVFWFFCACTCALRTKAHKKDGIFATSECISRLGTFEGVTKRTAQREKESLHLFVPDLIGL